MSALTVSRIVYLHEIAASSFKKRARCSAFQCFSVQREEPKARLVRRADNHGKTYIAGVPLGPLYCGRHVRIWYAPHVHGLRTNYVSKGGSVSDRPTAQVAGALHCYSSSRPSNTKYNFLFGETRFFAVPLGTQRGAEKRPKWGQSTRPRY